MCDNQETVTYASGEGTWKTKDLINKGQFIREMVSHKELVVSYVPTKDQAADIFTKFLEKGMHQNICGLLNLTDQEEMPVTDAVFAFRCEMIEDRVFDQRTAENKYRVSGRGTIEDKD